MSPSTDKRPRRNYDPRLKRMVYQTQRPSLATAFDVPRSTVHDWLKGNVGLAVGTLSEDDEVVALQTQVDRLKRRLRICQAVIGLLLALIRIAGAKLDGQRLPEGTDKERLLGAMARARTVLPLTSALSILGLSRARYTRWIKAKVDCELTDRPSCPKSQPQRLTFDELGTIHQMATSENYRHLPITRLAWLAMRLGKVFASPSTWRKLIRKHKWRRPRRRLHPKSPTLGIRADRPNQYWHIDASILRLLDGSRVYLHAVIDNFSRKILAWTVAPCLEPATTRQLLLKAAQSTGVVDETPSVLMDSGVENLNKEVDGLVGSGVIRRLLAKVDIDFSNSLVEAFWRSAKHQWLYLNELRTPGDVERLLGFFVDEHNSVPHSAFKGATPNEMYAGTAAELEASLAKLRLGAKARRLEVNRVAACSRCPKLE